MIPITLTVNGRPCKAEVSPTLRLVDFLRDHLYLTGAKEGCGTGDCGACSVQLDGRLVCSCLVLGVEAQGREVKTIEGMAEGNTLHPLQAKFIEHAACRLCWYD